MEASRRSGNIKDRHQQRGDRGVHNRTGRFVHTETESAAGIVLLETRIGRGTAVRGKVYCEVRLKQE